MTRRDGSLAAPAEPMSWSDAEVITGPAIPARSAKVTVSIRVVLEDCATVEQAADARGMTVSALMCEIVADWAARQRGDAAKPVTVSPGALHAALDQAIASARRATV